MAVDLSVFGRQKSLTDVQTEFEARKQAQALQQLQVGAALAQAGNGGLTAKDKLGFQLQMQNHADDLAFKQLALGQQAQLAQMTLGTRQAEYEDKKQTKVDLKMANDQNALTGITTGIDNQIQDLDSLIGTYDAKGNQITPPAEGLAGNFGIRGAIPNAPGSDASNAKAKLDQIRAGTFIGGLQNLKSQSATGASGLGAVSEAEGAKVQNAQAALQSAQDLPSLIQNAKIYRQRLLESKGNLLKGFNNVYGSQQPSQAPSNSVHWNDLK